MRGPFHSFQDFIIFRLRPCRRPLFGSRRLVACSADLKNTKKQERRTKNQGEPEPPQQQQTKEQNSNMQNTEHHKRQQQGQERRHLGVEKAPQKATKRRPTGPSKSSPVWASLEALFGAFWGSGGSFWGSRRPFWACPAEAENGPKRRLKTGPKC